jgi:hypothetical protein
MLQHFEAGDDVHASAAKRKHLAEAAHTGKIEPCQRGSTRIDTEDPTPLGELPEKAAIPAADVQDRLRAGWQEISRAVLRRGGLYLPQTA